MNKNIYTELLAPAGKWDALVAAVQNGADAVYLGEKSFSARKNASNFTWEEIENAVRYCHVRGVRVLLALNTLVSDKELSEFESSVQKAAKTGVDAIIVQDLGCAIIARKVCPDLPIHASTQLTSCNKYDVEALQNMGFSRVVLSRELSEKEIRRIYEATGAELEAFVHGALCISFSGKCLMSSFIGGRSGNRGMCAQPCRQMYSCKNKKGYLLSPRDLCLADDLEKMSNAGVVSFKIEGRMKSPEYVASVTNVYRKYLDSFSPLSREDEERLEKVFVRGDGFTKAYFAEKNTPEIMNYSISNDNLSARADESVLKEARASFREGAENKKISVDAVLCIKYNEPSTLTISDGKHSVRAVGAEGERAINTPLSAERAQSQIGKMGQTPFVLNLFSIDADDNITLPVSELNALRREACELLIEKRGEIHKRNVFFFEYPKVKNKKKDKPCLVVQIRTKDQFLAARNADRVLVPLSLWDEITPDERCFVLLPQVVCDDEKIIAQLSIISNKYGVYASTPGMIMLAKKQGRKVCADWSCNIYNSVSANALSEMCDGITLSPELSLGAIGEIVSKTDSPCEILCHGYQSVMTSRACLIRGITGKCDCTFPIRIKDKTGAEFVVLGDKNTHLNTVLNSRPTFMADKMKDVYKTGVNGVRLIFTTESGEETSQTIDMYRGKTPPVKPPLFTRGYLLS
ncbi:MAG: U32 family peptidase [Clostridia bacterium]|nr:U32 family peptidase [Clostridia bacterium]